MMRDWTGLEEEEEAAELDSSSGPGDGGSRSPVAAAVMGREERRERVECLEPGRRGAGPGLGDDPPPTCLCAETVVVADEFREICGLPRPSFPGVPGMFVSFLGTMASFRIDKAEGARPLPEPAGLVVSAVADSDPGAGDGPDEPLAAAAFRIWARSWVACRSVRYSVCWRRKSTVTWKFSALASAGIRQPQPCGSVQQKGRSLELQCSP